MMQKELMRPELTSSVGEHIGFELGAKMVKEFQDAYPNENLGVFVGKEIIESLLAQPGCVGIKMFNALNEAGEKTLVFVGLDSDGRHIIEYTTIDRQGHMLKNEGIVADRIIIVRPTPPPPGTEPPPPPPPPPGDTSWW